MATWSTLVSAVACVSTNEGPIGAGAHRSMTAFDNRVRGEGGERVLVGGTVGAGDDEVLAGGDTRWGQSDDAHREGDGLGGGVGDAGEQFGVDTACGRVPRSGLQQWVDEHPLDRRLLFGREFGSKNTRSATSIAVS